MTPKYKTIIDLANAFKSGELGNGYSIAIDKGCEWSLTWYLEDASEEEIERRQGECSDLFEGGDDITELFTALGIPAGPY